MDAQDHAVAICAIKENRIFFIDFGNAFDPDGEEFNQTALYYIMPMIFNNL